MGVDGRIRDLVDRLACVRVREKEVDREQPRLGKVEDLLAVRADRGRDVLPATGPILSPDDQLPVHLRWIGPLHDRLVGLPRRLVPVGRERVHGHSEYRLERPDRASCPAGHLEDPADDLVPVRSGDVGPESLPVAVREEAGVVQLADRRKAVALDAVAQPHRGVRIDRSDREVLGHPLDEPQRQPDRTGDVDPGRTRTLSGDIELEGVHELVAEDVIALRHRVLKRQNDPALEDLGEATGRLAHLLGRRVGLLEVGMRGVENERLPGADLVVHDPREPGVPALRHAAGHQGGLPFLLVKVDVEVLGTDDLPVERIVLDLVPPEVLRARAGGGGSQSHDCHGAPEQECARCKPHQTSIYHAGGSPDSRRSSNNRITSALHPYSYDWTCAPRVTSSGPNAEITALARTEQRLTRKKPNLSACVPARADGGRRAGT